MGDNSKIQWTQATWNVVTGCSKVSPGCAHCYAEREWPRLAGNPKTVYHGRKFMDVQCHPERLDQPVKWKRPRIIFVNSMSDLFHPDVPFKFIWSVWWRMATAKQHTFQVLTKRPERMKEFFEWMKVQELKVETYLPHVWLGVTAENQEQADIRIPILLQIPAAVRFVSVEPMLGSVDLKNLCRDKAYSIDALKGICRSNDALSFNPEPPVKINRLDWVICGGETGPGARPMHPDWARGLRDQCQAAGVPFFLKQMPINGKMVKMPELDGRVWNELPST